MVADCRDLFRNRDVGQFVTIFEGVVTYGRHVAVKNHNTLQIEILGADETCTEVSIHIWSDDTLVRSLVIDDLIRI